MKEDNWKLPLVKEFQAITREGAGSQGCVKPTLLRKAMIPKKSRSTEKDYNADKLLL